MNKSFIGSGLLLMVLFTSQCFSKHKMSGEERAALKKEQERQKKADKLRKKEIKKLEKDRQREQAGLRREARRRQAAVRKEEKKMEAEEQKLAKEFEREHRKGLEKKKRVCRAEEEKRKRLAKEKKAREKKERRRVAKEKRLEEHRKVLRKETEREQKKLLEKAETKARNLHLMQNWKKVREEVVDKNYADGRYADTYMLPAWPVSSWFFKDKALVNVSATYKYATDSYDSKGSKRDITALDFGEQTIHLKDVLLASKLLGQGKVQIKSQNVSFVDNFIHFWRDQEIKFNGESERYGLEFDFARHVLRDDITIGVQVPLLYARNRLDVVMDFPSELNAYSHNYIENASIVYQECLKRVFRSKGINEYGGSASGFGDITLFGNVEITTRYVDRIVAGAKVVLPTGKEESMSKLWAPALGNGDCAEFAAFASLLVNYRPYINPHLFLQGSIFSTAHVDKRVPHKVTSPPDAQAGADIPSDLMAMADRLRYTNPAIPFSDFDTTIRCFADKPVSVKFEKGPEFRAQVGNMFDKFIFRRAFLDIYYDVRVKWEDSYRALDRDEYNPDIFEENTRVVEHRIGLEYSHQLDARTRLKAVMNYSFAGTNAPKMFDIGILLGHSF